MVRHEGPPPLFGPDLDPDSGAPRHRLDAETTVLDPETGSAEIQTVG
jgi:hypothetical protein